MGATMSDLKSNWVYPFMRAVLSTIAGPAFGAPTLGLHESAKAVFFQKILRINGHVPWPVHVSSTIKVPEKIVRGSRCPGLSARCHIDGRNGIIFGSNVWIGPNVAIISMNHNVDDYYRYEEAPPIRIGENCWIGAHAIVLPGVELGPHTVVAAGAVITRSFPEGNQLLAGVPATVVRKLAPYLGNGE